MEKILFITGIVPNDDEVKKLNINFMNSAADKFQNLFIEGFYANDCTLDIISAPFIGAFPKYYKKMFYKPMKYDDSIIYVPFNNIWGIRNISRYHSLKRKIKQEKLYLNDSVVIYSVHTPFVKLSKWLKKLNANCKICLIVPDLPEYMNLKKKKTFIYRLGKYFDIKAFYKNLKFIDCFSFVSKHQDDFLNKYNKPFVVVESIYNQTNYETANLNKNEKKQIVYAGSLNEKFGIKELIESMKYVVNDAELILCGAGDLKDYVIEQSNKCENIKYLGVLNQKELMHLLYNADVLINPRKNNEEYTKYSFPSKNMEYLGIGKPVICYKLDGIPDEYDDLFIYPTDDKVDSLAKTINEVLAYDENEINNIKTKYLNFLNKYKNPRNSVKKILDVLMRKETK